jgi:ferredoxin
MEIFIDGMLCTGCSLCASELPEVFDIGDDGLAIVKLVNPSGPLAEKARETAAVCPVSVIRIEG